MTAKEDAKKRAKPQAAKRAQSPRARANQSQSEAEPASGEDVGEDPDTDSDDQEPEAVGDDRAVFDTEAEIVDSDETDSDERREPSDERDPAAEIEYAGDRERERERDDNGEREGEPDADERGLARFDALQAYMREVQRHPLLSADEEHKLAVQYQKSQEGGLVGDREIAARLVTANLRLVVKIAYEYRRAYRNMMDLVQEGNIGLMQAVKRYDPYRGVKLSSYAAWWIRAYMLRFILNNWRLVKVGTTQAQRKLFFNLNKEKARLTAMGIEPSHAEIAKRLNVAESEVTEMDRRLARADASLDATVNEADGRSTTRLELMPSSSATPDQIAEGSEFSELLHAELAEFRTTLSGKDIDIFDKRVVADEPLTLQELGDQFGVSRERVRQLESRLMGKLREHLRQNFGDAVGVGDAVSVGNNN
ncbi:MAG TPA: RNA polymerase factor sigma-32 [Polyangiaceae bacterium]|nr:RNA polymerase factor sigma-32 [Polyangiaceae bacterium]